MVPHKKIPVALFLGTLLAVLLISIALAAEVLNFLEAHVDGENGVESLDGIYAVQVSPDGEHVYTVSAFDDAVTVFQRDTISGTLTLVEAIYDNAGGVDGLEALRDLVISPDGKHVYTAALLDDAVAGFERDTNTGQLTFVEAEFDSLGGVDGLAGAHAITISPDGNHIYAAALSDDAITVFERNSTTGEITYVQTLTDGQLGTDGLDGVRDITISPDGKHIYTASNATTVGNDEALAVFERNATTGEVSFVEVIFDGTNGADGLDTPASVKVSPDGKNVYVGNEIGADGDDWYAVFSRNPATGSLTYVESATEGLGSDCIFGIQDDTAIAFRDSGEEVLLTSTWESGLYRFSRDPSTGSLTSIDHLCGDILSGFFGTRDLAVSPDGMNIYGAAFSVKSLAAFSIGETVLTINYSNGQPGSYFTVTGQHFPTGETATITINGVNVGSVPVDSVGSFTFLLNTTGAEEGDYIVTAEVNPLAAVHFQLDAAAPFRPQKGSGTIFNVPPDIAFTDTLFLPLTVK